MKHSHAAARVLLFLVVGLLMATASDRAGAAEDKLATRAAVVAPLLAERPAAFGRPIRDREAWGRLAKHPSFQGAVRRAEILLKEPLPEQPGEFFLDFSRTGNRTRWQRVAGQRRVRVAYLTVAECLENKGRFVPAFEALVRALCAEPTWVYPAHDRSLANFHGKTVDVDLASSALAWNLATARYLLGDRLSPEVRKLIRDNVHRRVLDPFRDMATGKRKANWWTRTTSNWNAVCLAGVTGTALAVVESREERALFIAAAEVYSRNFLRGFAADGYCTEGLGYWNYGFGHYLLLGEAICQATGGQIDLLSRKEVVQPATFGTRIEIANGVYPAFADCSVRARPDARAMAFISRRFRLGLRRWEDIDTASPSGALASAMMRSFPNSASQTPPAEKPALEVGLRSWFDKAGILIGRPADGSACRLAVALKGGHNAEHHNHNDVGSYVVVVGSEAVLVDPGGEVYTARTFSSKRYVSKVLNSYGHPVPLVAGQLQQKGGRARARVLKAEFTDDADTLVLDIASAYKVDGLKKLVRTFVYSRQGAGSLTVTDDVELAEPKPFGTAVVTFGQWKRLGPDALLIYGFEEAARVGIEASGDVEIQAEEIQEDVSARTLPTRIGIALKEPAANASISVTIAPMDVADGRKEGQLLRNGSFEHGTWGWSIPRDGMGSIATGQAASGEHSLRIVDTSREVGSNISSAPMRVGGRHFELRGKGLRVSGDGVGMYIRFLDAERRMLNKRDHRGYIDSLTTVKGAVGQWEPFAARFEALDGTAFLQVWIHSSTAAVVEAYLDDLEIVVLDARR